MNIIFVGLFLKYLWYSMISLPGNKILALSKLKAFAEDIFMLLQIVQFLFVRVEISWEKEKNAVYQHFNSFSHDVLTLS